jgi:hypothetical protein
MDLDAVFEEKEEIAKVAVTCHCHLPAQGVSEQLDFSAY